MVFDIGFTTQDTNLTVMALLKGGSSGEGSHEPTMSSEVYNTQRSTVEKKHGA